VLNKYLKNSEFSSYEDMIENFKIDIPENFNFAYDVLDEWAKSDPNKTALVWTNPEGDEKILSFGEMKEISDKCANFLTSCGVKKGDIVALILKRRWEFWPSIMACHKIGAIVLPVNHLMKKKDLVYRFNKVNVKAVICVNEDMLIEELDLAIPYCDNLKVKIMADGSKDGWYNWHDGVNAASSELVRPYVNNNTDTMIIYYTSGTTGMPNIVAHNYIYPLAHIITAKYWLNCEDNGLHLTISDTGWAKSVWGKLYGQWICGSAVFAYDYERFVADDILNLLAKYKITTFCAPPTIYRFFVKEDLKKYDFSNLHYTCTAGEALHPEVFNVFEKLTGLKIYEAYGQTEAVCMLATFPWVTPMPGSMGKPSPSYNISLIDDNFEIVADGEEGHLVIDLGEELSSDTSLPKVERFSNYSYGLFDGYVYNRDLDVDRFVKNYYFTGDMAWRDENGYYWFVGRSDDLIKTSGYRVGPFEVESVLMEHPSVLECAITGVPDPVRGQVIKATIALANGYEASDELAESLKEYVRVNTAPYKYPRVIEFVKELPKTISGKIRRVEIRDKDNQGVD